MSTRKINEEEIFSKSVRAGRRTYFFDVRSTKAGDYYLTITESRKDFNEDGSPFYKKHKIYLYKEDFTNFQESLEETCKYIIKEKGEEIISNKENQAVKETSPKSDNDSTKFTEVSFDELGDD